MTPQTRWNSIGLTLFVLTSLATGQQHAGNQHTKTVTLDGIELPLKFHDEFEKGLNAWEMTDAKNWKIKTASDKNHVLGLSNRKSNYQPPVRSPHNIAWIKDLTLRDFVIKLQVRNPQDTGNHRDCCIFFCGTSPDQFYYAHLGKKPDPASGQIMIVNKKPRSPLTHNEKELAWTSDWHRIKLTRNSQTGETRVFFDDMKHPVLSVKDKTLQTGRIGIGSFDDINDFDNVSVFGR